MTVDEPRSAAMEMAVEQFDLAANRLAVDPNVAARLRRPDRSLIVSVPTRMDDGRVGAFDLIVSDIQMPGFTALDILAGLRRTLSHTPVILITAFGDPLVRHKAERLGAVCVFDKPFDIGDLRSAVVHALARRTGDNPLAPWPPSRSSPRN